MNSLSDVLHAGSYYREQANADIIITGYLDSLCNCLRGVIPARECTRLREEAAFHLERLLNDYMLEGMAPSQAARHAVDKYGAVPEVPRQFLDAWYAHHAPGRLARRIGMGFVTAFICFGAATLLTTALIQYRVYLPEMAPLSLQGRLPSIRQLIPSPWPSLEINSVFLVLCGIAAIAPFAAGWMTGCKVLVRPARSVMYAQLALALYTLILGIQLLPTREGLLMGLVQLFYWLPAGCLAAHIAAQLTIRRRCRHFIAAETKEDH